ncbi:MAG TPA: HemK2/MTQ2 family protein methyltransferase [Candidatus Bilamarchaeum sp.]|nr:HemK2/MTQ2 family protein methyltransferase [Candidatus Bilamarchaeum sp.]
MEIRFGRLVISVSPDVYPPAEDSFMLARGAESLRGEILEIGCGSGIASLSAALAGPGNKVLGLDINPEAVECARANAKANKITNALFMESDLFSAVPKRKFDAILFNPPYLPTGETERVAGPVNAAFDGGKDGRKVVGKFLLEFDRFLRPGGTLLLVQSSLNDLEKTKKALAKLGYGTEIAAEEKFFFERLYLLRASKPKRL